MTRIFEVITTTVIEFDEPTYQHLKGLDNDIERKIMCLTRQGQGAVIACSVTEVGLA